MVLALTLQNVAPCPNLTPCFQPEMWSWFVCWLVGFLGSIWNHMDLCIKSCLASRLASIHGKNFNVGQNMQSVQPNFFIPAMLIDTIDCYHFLPLLLTLALPGGHKVSGKQNLLASFSWILFIWSGWNLAQCWSNLSWTSWHYFWLRFDKVREITAVFLTASKS